MRGWMAAGLAGAACSGGDPPPSEATETDGTADTATEPTLEAQGWRWEQLDIEGIAPRTGAATAGDLVVGGYDTTLEVIGEVLSVDATDGTLRGTLVAEMDTARYCACALYDPGRDEVLVIGGRDGGFGETHTAELISVATGEQLPLGPVEVSEHPVGCQAFFSPALDRGWVVGGYGAAAGFGTTTWRYDPAARALVALDIAGPSGRYDAGIERLDDGNVLLVGGMGGGGFDSQVWRFDVGAETWTEIPATSEGGPAGRRFPWTAVHDGALLYGYGTDSSMGNSVLRDLWAFDLATGQWAEVETEGRKPAARAFAARWPGPPGALGVLAFGMDGNLQLFEDAWALRPPSGTAVTR